MKLLSKKLLHFIQWIVIYLFALAYSDYAMGMEKPLIFPIPQQMQLTDNSFVLDESVMIVVPGNANEKDLSLAHALIRELNDKYGIALKVETSTDIPRNKKVVIMGTIDNPLIKKYCSDRNLNLSKKSPGTEGYMLEVSSNTIFVGGSDDVGAFYGLQSLRQLIQGRNGMKIQGVKVKDW